MHSRNNRAGILIGKGETPENAVKEVGMAVEGMNALPAALELAERYQDVYKRQGYGRCGQNSAGQRAFPPPHSGAVYNLSLIHI